MVGVFTETVCFEPNRDGPWWTLLPNSKEKFSLIFGFGIAPVYASPPHILSGLKQVIIVYTNHILSPKRPKKPKKQKNSE